MLLLDRLTAGAFRLASSFRDARAFHPDGVAFRAMWEPDAAPAALGTRLLGPAGASAIVRFSRGAGLPHRFPDILGVGIKVLDAHGDGFDQDLALASSLDGTLGRRLLVPQRDLAGATYSSVAPYEVSGRRVVVLADTGDAAPLRYDELAALATCPLDVRLRLAPGEEILGWLRVGDRLPQEVSADLRIDPWHTGPDLTPVGWLNDLRRPTYAASQEGRDAPDRGVRTSLHR